IFQPTPEVANQSRQQPLLREDELGTDILQQKAARAIGVLRVPGVQTELAEERRLLIAGDARNLDRSQTKRRSDAADLFTRPYDCRHHARGNTKETKQLV